MIRFILWLGSWFYRVRKQIHPGLSPERKHERFLEAVRAEDKDIRRQPAGLSVGDGFGQLEQSSTKDRRCSKAPGLCSAEGFWRRSA